MAKRSLQFSTKRLLIDKANSMIVITVGIAAFVTAFSLVASRSLLIKRAYQSRVVTAQEKARDQLKVNKEAVSSLKASYNGFISRNENLIGGSSTGNGQQDGDNAKIVLDALPSKYDFPALVTSLEKILVDRNYNIGSIGGTDQEAVQNGDNPSNTTAQTNTPVPTNAQAPAPQSSNGSSAVQMPFEFTAKGSYASMVDLLGVFQRSIRPIYVQTLTISAEGQDGASVQMNIQGASYYQPEKKLEIKYEVVK